jgi:hypothetical protein
MCPVIQLLVSNLIMLHVVKMIKVKSLILFDRMFDQSLSTERVVVSYPQKNA